MLDCAVFTLNQTQRLTGLSRRTIRRWQDEQLFVPDFPDPAPLRGPYRRIFSFRDLVGLRTLKRLRFDLQVALEDLKSVGRFLHQHRERPWSEMSFWVVNRKVVFRDPKTDTVVSGPNGRQLVIEKVALEQIAQEAAADARPSFDREEGTFGAVTRNRNIMGNRWIIAGTRIPTSIIWEFHEAGYSIDEIIAEYPDLNPEDVESAIRHESALQVNVA